MLRVVIWQFFFRSDPERKIVSEIKPPLLLHTQSQQLVSFQNFLLMTQGWWIQWTTYYMMTPWMRCLEYQARSAYCTLYGSNCSRKLVNNQFNIQDDNSLCLSLQGFLSFLKEHSFFVVFFMTRQNGRLWRPIVLPF